MSSPVMDMTDASSIRKAPRKESGKRKRPFPSINKIPYHLTKKMKQDKLYKPPTSEEMNELKETETMYHSSLFRFQIDELLAEVKLKEKYKMSLKSWLNSLKVHLKNLPSSDSYEINDQSWIGKGIKVPIMQNPKNRKGLFQFLPPTEVHEIGSYVLETICIPESIIDLAVKIPRACFQKQDFLNHLYHRKRALYLVCLAKSLTDSDLVENVEFAWQNNCHLKPTVHLRPKGKLGKHFSICLLPYPETETFKLSRFTPTKNNVRSSWFFGTNSSEDATIPTPQYNSTVLADLLLPNLALYAEAKISAQSIKDAIILLKVWCIQRKLYGGSALTGFIINMLMAYLILKKKINSLMSSYQVFRNALLVLRNENWFSEGAILSQDHVDNCPTLQEFHEAFDVVFVDPSGFLNICYSLSQESILMLQHEAALALKILDSASTDSFSQLFIQKVPCCRKFEYLVHFAKPKKFSKYSLHLEAQSAVLDNGGDYISAVTNKLCRLLKNGLRDRVLLVYAEMSSLANWDISKPPPNPNFVKRATIGLLINQDYVFNNLEKGPLADDPSTIEFRKFWGDKSELRRFKDGSIHEAILWPAETIHEKRSVVPQIISYIFQRHANIRPEDVLYTGMELDTLLTLPKEIFPKNSTPYGTGEETSFTLMQSYNSLVKILRKLDGLSLSVTSVQGTSAALRFTDVFPPYQRSYPLPMNLCFKTENALALKNYYPKSPSWIPALKVVVHLEGSGKWPDDIEALVRIKAALHVEMSTLLKSQFKLTSKAYNSFVDVLMDGYVFRLSVASHKEITLLKQIITSEGMVRIEENEESRQLECSTEILPKLNGILHGLYQQHNIYGTACRLAKRWISCQLLHDYVNDVIIELLMAFVFISPEPFTCPNSPQLAFQRFLTLLYTHDWETNPLIVNLNNELNGSEMAEIQSNFSSKRADLPAMVVAIPLDKTGSMWTQHMLTVLILKRLVKLSKTSLETLEKQLYISEVSDFKQIFRPPLTPYNVIIHLNKKFVPKRYCAVDMKEENKIKPFQTYHKTNNEKIPITDYDPVKLYLNDLKEIYGEYALFFYDIYGGDYIAVLWKPNVFASKQFKVSDINGCMVTGSNSDGTKNCTLNLEAILSGFSIIGGDLVKNFEMTEKLIC